ncbi:MAG: hypothetical protein NXI20_24185 [bacterium]|nr:hypothetical protein [bacterium]
MKTYLLTILTMVSSVATAQKTIPFDTANWKFNSESYVLDNIDGQEAIYLKGGAIEMKNMRFLNGTIEYDIRMTERRGFYGIRFRLNGRNGEEFYFRPHQSGNPDANQATPIVNDLAGWQLYFGPTYSFVYDYPFEEWMHVKLVVQDRKAQIYIDNSEKPNLSWNLKHDPAEGNVQLTSFVSPMHYANFSIQPGVGEIKDFNVVEKPMVEGIIEEWQVSDKFEEKDLKDLDNLEEVISARTWKKKVQVEENSAANLGWAAVRYDDEADKNTVFAKITFSSNSDQTKLFHFGYSDRVVALLNGQPIYAGDNKFRTRDYRYLGTIGLFDAIYLPLKKGENTLLLAVSEDFGGWGVTGKFEDMEGIKIK